MCGGIGEPDGVAPDGEFPVLTRSVDWDIERNLPVYTRDLVELADRWTHDGEHTLRSLILRFALDLGKPGEVEPVAPDGESRPPTPEFVGVPGGHDPSSHRWTEEWLKRLIREEIQEAFAQRVRERNAAWNRTREGGN